MPTPDSLSPNGEYGLSVLERPPLLVDCHVHLDSFTDEEVSEVIERSQTAGVGFVVTAGTTERSSERAIELSRTFPSIFAGVGVHPMDIETVLDEKALDRLASLASSSEKVLVISEIGLDFMEGAPDRAMQFEAFRGQIGIARELNLPIVFHSREAHSDVLRVLREERAYEVGGVMHYFQADERTAQEAVDLGFYVSLARPLLRLPHLQDIATELSLEHIVLETDAAPQPFKSKRENWTEPRHTRNVAEKLALLQGRTLDEVEETTTANVRRLLGKRWDVVERHIGDRS